MGGSQHHAKLIKLNATPQAFNWDAAQGLIDEILPPDALLGVAKQDSRSESGMAAAVGAWAKQGPADAAGSIRAVSLQVKCASSNMRPGQPRDWK